MAWGFKTRYFLSSLLKGLQNCDFTAPALGLVQSGAIAPLDFEKLPYAPLDF